MEKIYAAPINGDWYAVFVGDKKLTLPLSESDAKKIADRYNVFEELETENLQLVGDITVLQIENSSAAKEIERLKLQVEVLSAAFANSSEKEKSLMEENERIRAEYASLLHVCKKIASEESVIKRESHILDLCNVLDEI